ncbi:MAG: flippase-like domain-containing protein [Thaumarchaeota archaeon]|nr:flippase-like domain-containing protein [Nitrososphaerota archaeon]
MAVSSFFVIVISFLSGISLSDFATIGYLPFALAAAASIAGLGVGVLRFRVVVDALANRPSLSLGDFGRAKLASQFLALTTPSTTGGFFLTTAWLSRKGIDAGRAVWIGYFEMLVQIYVSSALQLAAAAYALSRGAVIIASAITVVALVLAVGFTVIFVIPGLRGINLPPRVFQLAARVVGKRRAERLETTLKEGALNFSSAARATVSKNSLPLVAKAVGLTLVEAALSGLALWFVMVSAGLKIDVFSSTLMAFGAVAIGALPVSVGGSGITEMALKYYLASVYGFSSWAAIVLWRIASYQVLLAISGIGLLLLVRRATAASVPGESRYLLPTTFPVRGLQRPGVLEPPFQKSVLQSQNVSKISVLQS